ncbi:recombination protein RecA [Entomoplasma freundtii]|uniref:Protein RecA n=1 Tax=Entomoplasma freundtii TaxID=74700 RepID=A0A2K8NUX5_9MOLU|nr:recombinase RecA [Entomoplasma freundtii]ATZ16433.1 recombinase A [Entomoplasma freundtii]TDY55963.1 recombination protein RecA [Entomoplasma freundtii]
MKLQVKDKDTKAKININNTSLGEATSLNEKKIWNPELLDEVIKDIEKQFGKNAIMHLDTAEENLRVETVSSGSFLIDQILGVGGYPKGRIIEIYGPESSGKTTLGLHAIAEVQKKGGVAAFLDVEHSLDPRYAQNLGVNLKDLLVSQPDYGEQALDILEMLVKSNLVGIIVLDSVASLTPKAELDGDMGDQTIGLQARLMSKALRKLNGIIAKTNTIVIFTNQLREKVGVIFGNPEVTPGGRALRFYSSIRLEVRKGETITENTDIIGNRVKVKVTKNKVAPPFKTALIAIKYNEGIDKLGEILDLALETNLLQKSGSWYSYENEKIGQGRQATLKWLENKPELIDKFKETFQNFQTQKKE